MAFIDSFMSKHSGSIRLNEDEILLETATKEDWEEAMTEDIDYKGEAEDFKAWAEEWEKEMSADRKNQEGKYK